MKSMYIFVFNHYCCKMFCQTFQHFNQSKNPGSSEINQFVLGHPAIAYFTLNICLYFTILYLALCGAQKSRKTTLIKIRFKVHIMILKWSIFGLKLEIFYNEGQWYGHLFYYCGKNFGIIKWGGPNLLVLHNLISLL